MSGENAECASCGVTAADLPYEDMGLTVAMASEFLFDHEGPVVRCNGCAESEGGMRTVEWCEDCDTYHPAGEHVDREGEA